MNRYRNLKFRWRRVRCRRGAFVFRCELGYVKPAGESNWVVSRIGKWIPVFEERNLINGVLHKMAYSPAELMFPGFRRAVQAMRALERLHPQRDLVIPVLVTIDQTGSIFHEGRVFSHSDSMYKPKDLVQIRLQADALVVRQRRGVEEIWCPK